MADQSLRDQRRQDDNDWQVVLEEVDDGEPMTTALLLKRNGELVIERDTAAGERDRLRRTVAAVAAERDSVLESVAYWRMCAAALTALSLLLLLIFALEVLS